MYNRAFNFWKGMYKMALIDDCTFTNDELGDHLLVNMKCSNCGMTFTQKVSIPEDDKLSDAGLMKNLQNFLLFHRCNGGKEYGVARAISVHVNEEKKVEDGNS